MTILIIITSILSCTQDVCHKTTLEKPAIVKMQNAERQGRLIQGTCKGAVCTYNTKNKGLEIRK